MKLSTAEFSALLRKGDVVVKARAVIAGRSYWLRVRKSEVAKILRESALSGRGVSVSLIEHENGLVVAKLTEKGRGGPKST